MLNYKLTWVSEQIVSDRATIIITEDWTIFPFSLFKQLWAERMPSSYACTSTMLQCLCLYQYHVPALKLTTLLVCGDGSCQTNSGGTTTGGGDGTGSCVQHIPDTLPQWKHIRPIAMCSIQTSGTLPQWNISNPLPCVHTYIRHIAEKKHIKPTATCSTQI